MAAEALAVTHVTARALTDQNFDRVKVLVARTLTKRESNFWSSRSKTWLPVVRVDPNRDQTRLKH